MDGKDLTKEWVEKYENSAYVTNRTQLKDIDANKVDHLLGMLCDSIISENADVKFYLIRLFVCKFVFFVLIVMITRLNSCS